MTFDPDNPKDEDEAEVVEMTREAAAVVEDAIFVTIIAAVIATVNPNQHSAREERLARQASKDAWKNVADKLLKFAASDD